MRLAVVSGLTTMGVDIALQRMVRKKSYDVKRTLRTTSYAFISTFPQNAYFNNLGKVCSTPLQKTMMNQFFFAPINIACGIAWNLALQNKFRDIVPSVRSNLLPGLVEGSLYWCPINILAFSLIKPSDQFLFFKAVSVPYKILFVNRTVS